MLTAVMLFLIQTIFNLYIYVVILRLILQAMRIRFDNPLSQFAIRFTQPVIKPLQKILPEVKGIDLAIVMFLLVLEMLKFFLLVLVGDAFFPNIGGLFLLSLGDMLNHLDNFYFYAIVFKIILSWLVPLQNNPLYFIATQITAPILYPIRRFVPVVGGFDFSPLIALILLKLLEIILITPLMQLGVGFL